MHLIEKLLGTMHGYSNKNYIFRYMNESRETRRLKTIYGCTYVRTSQRSPYKVIHKRKYHVGLVIHVRFV